MSKSVHARAALLMIAVSNLLAAFGGGTILRKGMGVLRELPALQGDSLLALLLGTTLGLLVLVNLPRHELLKRPFQLSGGAGILSLLLYGLVVTRSTPDSLLLGTWGWLFFGLLCGHFCFWFLARSVRSDLASTFQQKLSVTEFTYCAGIILGILVWQRLGLNISVPQALLINFALQLAAASLDWYFARRFARPATAETPRVPARSGREFSISWYLCFTGLFVFLTIAQQIANFGFAHMLQLQHFDILASDALAAAYFGSALAGIFCACWKTDLRFSSLYRRCTFGRFEWVARGKRYSMPVPIPISLCVASMLLAIGGWTAGFVSGALAVVFIVTAAFFYEVLGITALERIGARAKQCGKEGMVALSFGIAGFSGAMTLVFLMHSPGALIVLLSSVVAGGALALLCTARGLRKEGEVLKRARPTANQL